jgi:hypothetical protein
MHAYMQMAGDGDTGNGDPPPKDKPDTPTGEPKEPA